MPDNWALCSTDIKMYAKCTSLAGQPIAVDQSGGTSESSPLTAGVAALVIQAYRNTHNGTTPPPLLVKQLIASNTDDIAAPANQQGAGLVDAYKAVLAAENDNNGTGAANSPTAGLSDSGTQLNAVDPASTPESFTDTITNESSHAENLSFVTRALGFQSLIKTAKVTLSDTASSHIVDYQGITANVETVKFAVPFGENRLNASIAFQNASASKLAARVRMTLVDPNGKMASYDVPQGDGNFGNSQVANPAAGVWTAFIWSRDSADGGTTGPVFFGARVARYTTFGQVTPSSATVASGQSVAVTMHVSTPPGPGDASGAIVIGASRGGQSPTTTSTIPVTLRSLIPAGDSSFTANTTGGNGRPVITGQLFTYQVDVPSGSSELNAYITLANNPNYPFTAELVDPAGQAEAYASNTAADQVGIVNLGGAQLHALTPQAGRWRVIVQFGPQASGQQLSEQFTVATNQRAIAAGAGGLPDSPSTQLTAGQPSTYNVTIQNSGTAPEFVFADPRLPGSAELALGALGGAGTTVPININKNNIPIYLVPTDTTAWTARASTTGAVPIQFDIVAQDGDPDVISSFGQLATASLSANPVSQGVWDIAPVEYAAFGVAGGPTEPVATRMSVTTSPFDPAVSPATGDFEADGVNPAGLATFNADVIGPGQTATIPVTITPTGASGTPETGTLYLDDVSLELLGGVQGNLAADQVAAIPYSYTIK